MMLHTIFSSDVPVEKYIKETLKRYNKEFPKKYQDRPDFYRAALERTGPLELCTSFLDGVDYHSHHLQATLEYSTNPGVDNAIALLNGYVQQKPRRKRKHVQVEYTSISSHTKTQTQTQVITTRQILK